MNSEPVYQEKPDLRLLSVYAGTFLACSISIILSASLFASISDRFWYAVLFVGVAVVIEMGKFTVLPVMRQRWRQNNVSGFLTATALFVVLTLVSIMGSIGGLQSDTQSTRAEYDSHQMQYQSLKQQIANLQKQIELNNQSIARYQSLDRLTYGANPLLAENQGLMVQVKQVQSELSTLPAPKETAMLALLGALSEVFDSSVNTVQAWVFILLAVIVDAVAAFYLCLLQDQTQPSTPKSEQLASIKQPEPVALPDIEPAVLVASEAHSEPAIESDPQYDAVVQAIKNGTIRPSKNQVLKKLQIGSEKTALYFKRMMDEGILRQDERGWYQLT